MNKDSIFFDRIDKYYDRFKDAFPSMEYNLNVDESIAFMDECIKKNKTAHELRPIEQNVRY